MWTAFICLLFTNTNLKERRIYAIYVIKGLVHTTQNFVWFAQNSVNRKPFLVRTIIFSHQNFLKCHQTSRMPSSGFGQRPTVQLFVTWQNRSFPWQLFFYGSSYISRMWPTYISFVLNAKLACENIRFSSLFAAGDEERGETDVFAG